MSIDRLRAHYGFGRMPFAKGLAPGMLHRHAGHAEAVARIAWCVTEAAIGVICGEVGAGKTVALRGGERLDEIYLKLFALAPRLLEQLLDDLEGHFASRRPVPGDSYWPQKTCDVLIGSHTRRRTRLTWPGRSVCIASQ